MGNFAPVDEERDATDLEVIGELPPELDGVYVRNGPNPVLGTSTQWFMGDGMLHGVRIRGGRAEWYRNRYVATPLISRTSDPAPPPNPTAHPSNTSLIAHAGSLFSLAETGLPYAISPADLSTIGVFDYEGRLTGAMTAHPKIDPATGEMLFFGYSFGPPFLTFHQVSARGELVRSEVIEMTEGSMMHDFAVTTGHVIFIDVPLVFAADRLATGLPLGWSDTRPLKLGIMPRSGSSSDVFWVEVQHGMIVHTMNAHEDGAGNIVVEAMLLPELWRHATTDFNTSPQLWRFTVNLASRKATSEQLDERVVDFPQINRSRLGSSYRYGYGMHFTEYQGDEALGGVTGVVKYDLEKDSSSTLTLDPGEHPDEVVFVPRDGAKAEDDGYLMGFLHDARTDTSYVAVHDAQSLETLARVRIPVRVPTGFHGLWVPES